LFFGSFVSVLPRTVVAQPTIDLEGVKVAVYGIEEYQSSIVNDNPSFNAMWNMFLWMNATVELVEGINIIAGELSGFDLLVFPAWGPNHYIWDLGQPGMNQIRQFIAAGGSLFSVCRGTEFVIQNLALIDAELHYITAYMPQCMDTHTGPQYLLEMNVNRGSTGPDLLEEPTSYRLFCSGSAWFVGDGVADTIPILTYPENDEAGMIVFRFGAGTVCLCTPHPEFEEGSDRDNAVFRDRLNDTDSEWDLVRKVSYWLVEASPDVPAGMTYLPLVLVGVIGIVVAIGGLIYILKVKREN
jgi:glutamine amidotransferase-like uncharacterized protein